MKKIAVLMILASAAAGCAPMLHGAGGTYPGAMYPGGMYPPFAPRQIPTTPDSPWAGIVGRWDNLLALGPTAVLGIITADGATRIGRYAGAGSQLLRIVEDGQEIELARKDVARVDLLAAPKGIDEGAVALDAVKGALTVGGVMALVPYLATGKLHLPPGRFWAFGGVVGGVMSVERQKLQNRARTLYVSPDLIAKW